MVVLFSSKIHQLLRYRSEYVISLRHSDPSRKHKRKVKALTVRLVVAGYQTPVWDAAKDPVTPSPFIEFLFKNETK